MTTLTLWFCVSPNPNLLAGMGRTGSAGTSWVARTNVHPAHLAVEQVDLGRSVGMVRSARRCQGSARPVQLTYFNVFK